MGLGIIANKGREKGIQDIEVEEEYIIHNMEMKGGGHTLWLCP